MSSMSPSPEVMSLSFCRGLQEGQANTAKVSRRTHTWEGAGWDWKFSVVSRATFLMSLTSQKHLWCVNFPVLVAETQRLDTHGQSGPNTAVWPKYTELVNSIFNASH